MNQILGVAFLMGNLHLQAQHLGLEYDTELQTNFRGDFNWVNLLRLDGAMDVSHDLSVKVSTISVAKTCEESLIDDLQGYSNIEEENLPLGIAVLGAEYRNRRSTYFIGIRNVNEDYFTSPLTSLFVNSSCGIFPTISGNYNIANYPLSSWCIHYKVQWEDLALQTSLYEGLGHRRILGRDNVFTFSPRQDGIFSITSAEYDKNGSNYSVGCAVYYGVHTGDENGVETTKETTSKKVTVAPWLNVERRLTDACSVMAQASCSTSKENCRYYFGLGASYKIGIAQLGLFTDYAKYKSGSEYATELTCQIPITSILTLQPTIEAIRTDTKTRAVGIVRLGIQL